MKEEERNSLLSKAIEQFYKNYIPSDEIADKEIGEMIAIADGDSNLTKVLLSTQEIKEIIAGVLADVTTDEVMTFMNGMEYDIANLGELGLRWVVWRKM